MVVKKLTIENFGTVKHREIEIEGTQCLFFGEARSEIFAALSIVVGNRLIGLQVTPYCFGQESRFCAEIERGNKTYEVEAVCDRDAFRHCAVRAFCDGRRLDEEERRAVFVTSEEEEECSFFVNKYDYRRYVPFAKLDYTEKLSNYREALKKRQTAYFAARTGGVGITPTFCGELERFCDGFSPRIIRPDKGLWQIMDGNGKFCAHEKHERAGLSESDTILLDYFSFVELNRFWKRVRESMGGGAEKPLFVFSLLDCMDPYSGFEFALRETRALGRQTFVFTSSQSHAEVLAREDGLQIVRV